jgi:hypothetical protein
MEKWTPTGDSKHIHLLPYFLFALQKEMATEESKRNWITTSIQQKYYHKIIRTGFEF